jgi:hypothetical protein
MSPKWSFILKLSNQHFVDLCHLSHDGYIPCPSYPSWFQGLSTVCSAHLPHSEQSLIWNLHFTCSQRNCSVSHALIHIHIPLALILPTSHKFLLSFLASSPGFGFQFFISYIHENVNLKQAITHQPLFADLRQVTPLIMPVDHDWSTGK